MKEDKHKCPRKKPPTVYEKLCEEVDSYLKGIHFTGDIRNEVPKKWEKYGDFVLVEDKYLQHQIWRDINLLNILSRIFKCQRIAIKSKIKSDDYRSPRVVILLGSNPWTTFNDNGIKYTWNIEKSMFSSGNINERHRISTFNCRDEIVVDLYAGIGYFTLPYLVYTHCTFLYACEWNPVAVVALKKNLILNKVEDRCQILEGDNRLLCPKLIADRVNLGLLPDCEKSWETACLALKKTGGIFHLHGNVDTKPKETTCSRCLELIFENVNLLISKQLAIQVNTKDNLTFHSAPLIWKHEQWFYWCVHVLHSLSDILLDKHKETWNVCCFNVQFVKSYAPFVDHLVLDLQLSPL